MQGSDWALLLVLVASLAAAVTVTISITGGGSEERGYPLPVVLAICVAMLGLTASSVAAWSLWAVGITRPRRLVGQRAPLAALAILGLLVGLVVISNITAS